MKGCRWIQQLALLLAERDRISKTVEGLMRVPFGSGAAAAPGNV
jgi:hypothetical protein